MGLKRPARRPVKLRTLFIRYLVIFCVGAFCWAQILVILCSSFLSGRVFPANYAEQQLAREKEAISASETVTPAMIPGLCRYAVYSADGKVLSGNLSGGAAKKAWNLLRSEESGQDLFYCYLKIPRKNGACIVRYSITPQFRSPALRRLIPNPEGMAVLLFLLGFIVGALVLAALFGKKVAKKLESLRSATEKIRKQDLEFQVESCGVAEIDAVLASIGRMKEALKDSLKKQWDLEQARREQICALAHDIKTPVTVVRGNVDLLAETAQTDEQKEYTGYIGESARQMERYIKALIELSKAEIGYTLCMETIDSRKFLKKLRGVAAALTAAKHLTLNFKAEKFPPSFSADAGLLRRAVANIVSNAAEYSPDGGAVDFLADSSKGRIRFRVTDSGKGFSPSDLKRAAERFYRGDKSRSSGTHYGMELFIADSIARRHGGSLSVANSPDTGGGRVTVEIPTGQS